MIICFIICVLTVISYVWGKFSLATTAITSMMALLLFGCLEPADVLGYFGNGTGIMIVAMFIVAAGFNKTQFVKNISRGITHIAKGNLTKVMAGYVLVGILLGQFIQSNLIVFSILAPLLANTVKEMNISPSKVMYPLGVACIATTSTLPLGAGATVYAELNGYLEANGYVGAMMTITDPMRSRLPVLIVCALYCIFIAPRLAPDQPVVAIKNMTENKAGQMESQPVLPAFQERCGYIIFFGVTVALIFSSKLGLASWEICVIGALLTVLTGVLTPKEATNAMPIWVYLLYVGSIAMAGALNNTGAGALIGDTIAKVASQLTSNVAIYLLFFIVPFIMTQFMLNRTVMLIFYPIVIQTCMSMNANPIGILICIQAACLTAFMTPMATGTVPVFMGEGGYDLKSVVKQSILPAILFCVVTVVWNAIAFPLF
jgi:di/tricarboxylate transporter